MQINFARVSISVCFRVSPIWGHFTHSTHIAKTEQLFFFFHRIKTQEIDKRKKNISLSAHCFPKWIKHFLCGGGNNGRYRISIPIHTSFTGLFLLLFLNCERCEPSLVFIKGPLIAAAISRPSWRGIFKFIFHGNPTQKNLLGQQWQQSTSVRKQQKNWLSCDRWRRVMKRII